MAAIVKGPYLQWPTPEAMTVMWETAEEADATVLWYETELVHSGLNGAFRTVEGSERVLALASGKDRMPESWGWARTMESANLPSPRRCRRSAKAERPAQTLRALSLRSFG